MCYVIDSYVGVRKTLIWLLTQRPTYIFTVLKIEKKAVQSFSAFLLHIKLHQSLCSRSAVQLYSASDVLSIASEQSCRLMRA